MSATLSSLKQALVEALKAHDTERMDILRLAISAIDNERISVGHELSEDEVIDVLRKEIKKVKDSISEYEKYGREDKKGVEERQLAVLEQFVPKLMSAEEIEDVVRKVIETVKPSGMGDFGRVMGSAMKELKGKADGNDVSQVVKKLLGEL